MTIKKLLLGAMAFFSLAASTACEKQEATLPENLPADAKLFIETHFAGDPISYAIYQVDGLEKEYDVRLESGVELDFYVNGQWQDIDCGHNAVPASVIPESIAQYVSTQYATAFITQISKETRYRIHVELSNTLELVFDQNGKYIRLDD